MDAFISHVLETFRLDAETAAAVFPSTARVVLSFCERVTNDVVSLTSCQCAVSDSRLASTFTLSSPKQGSFRSTSSYKRPQRASYRRGSW